MIQCDLETLAVEVPDLYPLQQMTLCILCVLFSHYEY